MAIAYTQEYWEQLLAAHEAQKTSAAFLEINDVAINYNTEYEAFEAMANTRNPYGEAWYYDPVRNVNGDIIGMDYVQVPTSVENPPAVIDSNVSNPVFTKNGERIRINGSSGGTPPNNFSKGAKTVSSGSSISSVAGKLVIGVAAAGLGIKLGKMLSQTLYDIGGGWQFNPDNWSTMLQGDELEPFDKWGMRTLFGLDDSTGEITPYMPSDALGAMFLTMLDSGAFDRSGYAGLESYTPKSSAWNLSHPEYFNFPIYFDSPAAVPYTAMTAGGPKEHMLTITSGSVDAMFTYRYTSGGDTFTSYRPIYVSKVPFVVTDTNLSTGTTSVVQSTQASAVDGVNYYYVTGLNTKNFTTVSPSNITNGHAPTYLDVIKLFYNQDIQKTSGKEGVEDDPDATDIPNPNTITGTDLDTVNQQLRQNYPDLYDGEVYEDVPQKDGTNKRIKYVPVPLPNLSDPTKPVTGDNHQNNPQIDTETNTDTQLKTIIDLITQLVTPNITPNPTTPTTPVPPDTGTGNTPPIATPVGSASSLWKIYNPTQAQVDAFGSWLWDSNFVEQIKRLFNDPMQAIIGIHKVFATPSIGGTATIKVGYLDSQVPSAWVDNQYSTVDCGSVNLREYFGNVFDYAPYTKIQLYLPFIGIVDLDVGDVMRSTISVKYHVDVLTGACLADVHVKRDNVGGVLYQFAGSAIVTYPISSGTYLGVIAGIGAVATGAVASIMTGGLAGAALGVAGTATGLSHLHANVGHSGGFSGCAGAMGSKKPYIIVSRPQIAMANKYEHYTGIPANSFVNINDCSGYTKVKAVYVNSITRATEEEKNMIEAELKAGVLV